MAVLKNRDSGLFMMSSAGRGAAREDPSNKTERATRGRLVLLVCVSFAQLIEYTNARVFCTSACAAFGGFELSRKYRQLKTRRDLGQIRSPQPSGLGASFVVVSGPCHRLALVSSSILLWAASCQVFPDEAVLPSSVGGASGAHAAGQAGQLDPPVGGAGSVDLGGAAGEGASASGGVAGVTNPGGGTVGESGAGGSVIGPCEAPQQRVVDIAADTWIDAARPTTTHGNDKQLLLVGGGEARRALLQVVLPAASEGAWLIKATLTLNLETNADSKLSQRSFSVHELEQPFVENRATWLNFNSGNTNTWKNAGGDFGPALARAALAQGTMSGAVSFDLTMALRVVFSSQAVPLSLIMLEDGTAPTAPAELAFTATEGDASDPTLVVDFCAP
jgi:hypothetical protein